MKKLYALAAVWLLGTVITGRAIAAENLVPTNGIKNKAINLGMTSLVWPVLLSDSPRLALKALPKRKAKA